MKTIFLTLFLLFSVPSFSGTKVVSVFGTGSDYSSYAPLCVGVRGDSKKEAKWDAKVKCAAARGRYKGIEDSDTDCEMYASGACYCVTNLTIECEL